MKVEIYADVVCPWCYLGQARFRAALEEYGGPVEVVWRPFQLDPGAPGVATPADAHLAEKFGGAGKVAAAHAHLRGLAAEAGLPYEPERAMHVNTRDAHRVIALALAEGGPGIQDAVAERIFRAQHVEGRNVGDAGTLAEIAAEAGLDAGKVRLLLAGDDGIAEVASEIDEARRLGITGVPFFLFEGQWGVSGAQPAEVLTAALREVATQTT